LAERAPAASGEVEMKVNRSFRFLLVDAFAKVPFGGNPCAVVLDADTLSDSEMLAVAKEMNQSETAFLMKSKKSDLRARYFTPEREIPLAGHPTIASIHAALEEKLIVMSGLSKDFSLELNDGPIKVTVQSSANGQLIRMFQRKPEFLDLHDPTVVLSIFNLSQADLLSGAEIQTVSTGTRQLMVPLASHTALKKVSMRVDAYKAYRDKMGFFSPHFFCLGGATERGATFARHLGVTPDTMEDAFTGSATGGMAAYLWKYGYLEQPLFIAEQGHWMGRPGQAEVEIFGTPNDIEGVAVSGYAVTVVRGELRL
jgi:trans-2,3-dihydro-3-hydroxyanthranilate isomerase